MRFLGCLYNIYITLANTDLHEYLETRITLGQHEDEPPNLLAARICSFLFGYKDGTELLSKGQDQTSPCYQKIAPSQDIEVAGFVGDVKVKEVRHLVRNGTEDIKVFFYSDLQLSSFCKELRGTKENWVKNVRFYLLPEKVIEELSSLISQRSVCNATIPDSNTLYLEINEQNTVIEIKELDIWSEYQDSLVA